MSLKGLGGSIKAAQKKHERPSSIKQTMPLSQIKDRPHGNTREIKEEHCLELMESIKAVGLIQPLAVDTTGHLLAGSHRRMALLMIQESDPQWFERQFSNDHIPVRIFAFDATSDAEQALAIEAAENEKRRDYTPAEVRDLAERLVKAGYRRTGGRPKKNEKALTPALMTIVGKSKRTVERYLAGDSNKTPPHDGVSKWEKRIKQLKRWEAEASELPNGVAVVRGVAKLRQLLEQGSG